MNTQVNYEKKFKVNFPLQLVEEKLNEISKPLTPGTGINPYQFDKFNALLHTFQINHCKIGGLFTMMTIQLTEVSESVTEIHVISTTSNATTGHNQIVTDEFFNILSEGLIGNNTNEIIAKAGKGCIFLGLFLLGSGVSIISGIGYLIFS